jgi:hypothetical protein
MAVSGAADGCFKWKIWYRLLKSARIGCYCNITDTKDSKAMMIDVVGNVVFSKNSALNRLVIAKNDESS